MEWKEERKWNGMEWNRKLPILRAPAGAPTPSPHPRAGCWPRDAEPATFTFGGGFAEHGWLSKLGRRATTSARRRHPCRYRGIRSSQLAGSAFIEVSYLLIYGELPTRPRTSPQDPAAHPAAGQTLLRWFPAQRLPVPVLWSLVSELCSAGSGRSRHHHRLSLANAADHRRVRVQEVQGPAVPVPGQLR